MLETKNLRLAKDRFSNSILSARLICILDFVFALSMTPPEGQTSRRKPIGIGGRHEWTRVPQPNEGARQRADLRPHPPKFLSSFFLNKP
jgi:hypothetical protein